MLEEFAKIAEVAREEASTRKVYKMLEAYLQQSLKKGLSGIKGRKFLN